MPRRIPVSLGLGEEADMHSRRRVAGTVRGLRLGNGILTNEEWEVGDHSEYSISFRADRLKCRRETLAWEYGTPLIGVALGSERLFSGQDADWETRWNPSQPDATATLWRYMSFAKFCSLLEREALFFSLVGKMADRYEGFVYPPQPGEREDRLREAEAIVSDMLQENARSALVSCWTESGHESSLMWESYAGDEGVAVRTTFEALEKSIRSVAELPVTFGQVQYVDYRERQVPRFGWAPLFHKRVEYHGEEEVRAILPGPPFKAGKVRLDPDVEKQGGRYVPVDLDILVKEIRVPPHCAPWFARAVESVVERSPVTARVARSAIELAPHDPDGGPHGQT